MVTRKVPFIRYARLLWLVAPLMTGCSSLSFAIANFPAHFSRTERRVDVTFGPAGWQKLDVYLPVHGPSASALPIILFWYGGGWTEGSKDDYRFVGAALAERGYIVMLPNYRHYPEVRFPTFLEDAASAVRWAEAHSGDFGGDSNRIVLMGHSAGAYMAAMLALNPAYLTRIGANSREIVGLIGLSGPYELSPNTPTLHAIFAKPYTSTDWQVTRYVSALAPPTLLIHGGKDALVWPSNSEHLASDLESDGVPVHLHIYAGRGHAATVGALAKPLRVLAPTLKDIDDFMSSLR